MITKKYKQAVYREFCSGCGLCSSIYNADLVKDSRKFECIGDHVGNIPEVFLQEVCPAGGRYKQFESNKDIWGNYESVHLGWATNNEIRTKASSGGIITSICLYLLKNKLVDGIIQTRGSKEIAYKTETIISRNFEDVYSCMGSRYSISSPLYDIKEMLRPGEKYAFVGKPCDVYSLRKYLQMDFNLAEQIIFLFSFFCAGEPSDTAQNKLLEKLSCNADTCKYLQYRGNGWPGYATAINKNGVQTKISYEESWGKILGRDVRKICRFCFDGIGLAADVACGDAWYLNESKAPSFAEQEGRNVIFARTKKGHELIELMQKEQYIYLENYSSDLSDLKYIQKYQYERRASMYSMIFAMKLLKRTCPFYNLRDLKEMSKYISKQARVRRFLGIIKRLIQKKIY